MTHVHYKFSSKLSYDTVVFDGPHITLRDLKRQIMGREKLKAGDCDLQITNAQSKQEYTDDEGLIPKGSSVIVRRIPVSGGKSSSSSKTNNNESSAVQFHHTFGAMKAMDDQSSSRALPFFAKMANLAEADVSEEDKIKVMLNQSTYDSMNYNKKCGAVLPANYTCYRCGNTGHHIRNCPTSGQDKNFEAPLRIKKSTGIPRSFMVEVDDPNIKGAMLTNCGRYAIPAIDAEAYAIGKKEKPPFIPQENPKSEAEEDPVPEELLCLICHDLLSDAVVIPCCGNSYCDDCIRTILLDSEEHICPTCSQSDVSPDTLIANKFLRQAVNNFKKERGYTKSLTRRCGASQSQNSTTRLSPVPTPPPLAGQSQPQKPHQPTYSQQDSLQHHPKVVDTLQLSGAPPVATGPTSAYSMCSPSLQSEQSCLEIPKTEAEEKTQDDSAAAAAAPSVQVSNKEPTAAPSQLIPVVNHTIVAEQPQTASMNQQQSSSSLGSTPSPCGPPNCWDSSSSSSSRPTRVWTESQQLTSSSSSSSTSYSATTSPLFPSPLFLSVHQSHRVYPPGYQPTTPIWTVPSSQGTPIPSLCSSTSTSSIPSLIPDEWYRNQRKRKERFLRSFGSPHRGSTYRHSSSSSKSKSSRSYSRSSSRSRSRSRSRSQGRSRRRSPYSRHKDLHTHSHSSSSYNYGYKRSRSPTPSSSSSPRVSYYSRSKSPSDHQKKRHHSRHQNKKSASSSYSSRRRGERSEREIGGSEADLASYLYAQHTNQTTSLDLDRERYLQWKKEYKEWCEKYFSSYVGHFHQLPLPLINLPPPPPPPPQWVNREGNKNHSHANSDSHYQPQVRHAARTDGRSPSSQSSSDSRSPSSQSSSDSRSTPSSDSRSSPSHTSNDSHSPPFQSSSGGRTTVSEDGAQSSAYQQKYSHLPIIPTKGIKEVELQERSKDNKQVNMKNLEDIGTLKHDQRRAKKHEEGRGEQSSSPDVADSTDDSRKDERPCNTGPNDCKDGTSVQDEAATSNTLKSVQPSLKPNKSLDKHCERESREQRKLKGEKGWRRGKHSDSRQDVERLHKVKPSKEADTVDKDRYRNPGGRKVADTRSEKNRKRTGEEMERNETQRKSESPSPFDRKKQKNDKKKEIKTRPLTERDIWEEGIKVKPQKKISININLDGKRKEAKNEIQDLSGSEGMAGKIKEENEKTGNREEEKLNRDTEAGIKQNKEFSRENEGMCEEKIKPGEVEASKVWEKGPFRDDKPEVWQKIAGEEEDIGEKKEDREEEDFDLWHCALRGVVEEKESEKLWEEGDMETSKKKEVTRDKWRSIMGKEVGEERIRNESQGQEMAELVRNSHKDGADGKSICNKNREIPMEKLNPKGEEELMEEVKGAIKKEEGMMMSKEQMNNSHHDRPKTAVDDGSCEDCQERKAVGKTLPPQDSAVERKDQLVLIQVPLSKWEEEFEEEQDKTETTTKNTPVGLPPPSVIPTNLENEQKRQKLVNIERERNTEVQKDATLSSSNRSVAPSSGKDRIDNTMCTDGERKRRKELERQRDRERWRESERPRDRQTDSRRSKDKRREKERGRYRGSERGHSSTVSVQKRNHPSSSHFSSSSVSHDTEKRNWQRGGDQGSKKNYFHPSGKPASGRRERSSISTAVEVPEKNAHKIHRNTLLDSKCKNKNHPHDYYNHRDPSWSYRHQDRPAGTHHSPSSLSHSQVKDRDPLPSESFSLNSRVNSPGWDLMQNRSRNESKKEEGEWKQNKVDMVIRESKGDRWTREMEAREGGSRWEDEADNLAGETKWKERRELEEGERSSSRSSNSSSSASLENSKDDRRKGRKKQKKHKKEKRGAAPELLEEREIKKYKESDKNIETREKESGGEVDGRENEEEDQARLCSVMLS